MSNAAFLNCVQKLRIEPGDILLVSNSEVLQQLTKVKSEFSVPLIYDPTKSGISKLTREDLINALDRIDTLEGMQE